MSRYLIISSDCHAGLPTREYRSYLESKYHQRFDESVREIEATREKVSRLLDGAGKFLALFNHFFQPLRILPQPILSLLPLGDVVDDGHGRVAGIETIRVEWLKEDGKFQMTSLLNHFDFHAPTGERVSDRAGHR